MKKLFTLLIMLSFFRGISQKDSYGNAFLKDSFVEVAIAPCGIFASTTSVPAGYGYHPRGSGHYSVSTQLGFVANPAKNNWATYVGDYFLPGSPEEGFGISIGNSNYNNNQICGSSNISGGIIDYQSTSFEKSATWQGNIGGLTITAKTYIPAGAVYFVTKIKITNTSGSPVNNIYYMHNIDPDQGVNTPGSTLSYYTYNTIVSQNPNACNRALVSATTLKSVTTAAKDTGDYIGLGSVDPRARVTYGGFSNRNANYIWNGTGLTTSGTKNYGDSAISISFKIGTLNPNDTTTFAFACILKAEELEQALAQTYMNLSANGITANIGNINNICYGSSVPLNLSNTGTYTSWLWSPATGLDTTQGTLVTATLTGPVVYTAIGSGICGTVSLQIPLNPITIPAPGNAGPISGPTTLNAGQPNIKYSIASVPNATYYQWDLPPGATINSAPNDDSITISLSNNGWCGDITVRPVNSCGSGSLSVLHVCINSPFTIKLTDSSFSTCLGGLDTLKLNYSDTTGPPLYYTLTWSAAAVGAGFDSYVNAPITRSPIKYVLPPSLGVGVYTGQLRVGNGIYNSVTYPITININSFTTPSLNIYSNTTGIIIPGTPVTFTAVATNGGDNPVYQWYLNGALAGSNYYQYTNSNWQTGDSVYCIVTSNAECLTTIYAYSNGITVTVPLTLLSFKASLHSTSVLTLWQTAQEINTSHFIIQRSSGGSEYYDIGRVEAWGNSSVQRSYSFADNSPANGLSYYRLKMIDKDGRYTYSQIAAIKLSLTNSFTTYPNPTKDQLSVQVTTQKNEVIKLIVTDMQGRKLLEKIKQVSQGINTLTLNVSSLAKGSYILSIAGSINGEKTFIKQ